MPRVQSHPCSCVTAVSLHKYLMQAAEKAESATDGQVEAETPTDAASSAAEQSAASAPSPAEEDQNGAGSGKHSFAGQMNQPWSSLEALLIGVLAHDTQACKDDPHVPVQSNPSGIMTGCLEGFEGLPIRRLPTAEAGRIPNIVQRLICSSPA